MLHYFLSYAHGEQDDTARVERFFNDLSVEIRVLTGEKPTTAVGFYDDGALRLGDDWPLELLDALCRAQTLIALFSPRYFRSEFCGKEWTVFSERVRGWQPPDKMRRPRLIPIFWVRTQIPDFLDHVHHRDAGFGAAYEREGLRELIRENGRDYERFVLELAKLVHRITSESPPMPDSDLNAQFGPDLRAVGSAFHPRSEPHRPKVDAEPLSTKPAAIVVRPRPAPEARPEAPQPRPILWLDNAESPEPSGPDDPDGPPQSPRNGGHGRP